MTAMIRHRGVFGSSKPLYLRSCRLLENLRLTLTKFASQRNKTAARSAGHANLAEREETMKFGKLVAGAVLAQGLALLSLSGANANVTLTYTGNDFTNVASPYTRSDMVTATITLSASLGDSLNFETVSPLAFTLNDGVDTLTNTSTLFARDFRFSTDANGNITQWVVGATVSFAGTTIFTHYSTADFDEIDEGQQLTETNVSSGFVEFNPGGWTETSVAVPAPVIGHGLPALLAVGGLLFGAKLLERGKRGGLQLG
jgi:hypothetical protein